MEVWGHRNGTTTIDYAVAYVIVSNGVRTSTNLRLLLKTQTGFFYKSATGSISYYQTGVTDTVLYTYGGANADGGGGTLVSDTGGSDPEGDNPGRDPNGAAEDAPNNDTPTDLGALDKNGAKVTQPGPGVWVWEVARIYPDGRVEQRHVGDILFSPAPQVQLRENAKIAALP